LNKVSAWDWTTTGKVLPIKDQGSCGSCWAFAANAVHESTHAILKGGSTPDLSEQELVDCSWSHSNQGCNGGWYFWAWNYLKPLGGIIQTKDYTYTARDQECKSAGKGRVSPITGYTQVAANDASIQGAAQTRPVAIAVDASNWSGYGGGVMSVCGNSINHAVTIVGYVDGQYWLVRNSWGSRWGENGHIKLKHGTNTCAMRNYVYILNM